MAKLNVPQFYNISKRKRKNVPGEIPGTFKIYENAFKSKINVYSYNADVLEEFETENIEEATNFITAHANRYCWLDVKGLGSQEVLNHIKSTFNINALVMEDVVNTHQRPKCEEYDNYLFVVSRMMALDKRLVLNNEQLSFICMENLLITFQEDYDDVLDPVRLRLRNKIGQSLRNLGPSYLMYALMDTVIDHYFTIISRLSDELDMIEDLLYKKPHKLLMYRIQGVKKIMLVLRRAVWPERDKLAEILKMNCPIIKKEVKVFLRDAYDHSIQVMDLVESHREMTHTLMDLYLSLMSNKMNEVMKFLTVISAIFIPLTFIAGIYGMNFSNQDPKTGAYLQSNMPELYAPHGYIYCLVVMLLIACGQIFYFVKKGWFRD